MGDRPVAEAADLFYADMAASNTMDNGWATRPALQLCSVGRDRAVRLEAEAHREGWPHWWMDHLVDEYVGLRGYEPFEAFMRPNDG